ncbi:MAG: hypothetical protein LBL36_04400 [Clostridiales Family XIII bacterium]|jgi:uncharacterized membrane protein YjjP (DUF1212 family)|nr:hypothetical protein [Clostridiales Family XIII bacterium]
METMKSKRISRALLIGGGIMVLPMMILASFYIFVLQQQIAFSMTHEKVICCVGLSGATSMLIGLMIHVCLPFRNKNGN